MSGSVGGSRRPHGFDPAPGAAEPLPAPSRDLAGDASGLDAPSLDQVAGGAVIEPGMRGPAVVEIQRRLTALGFAVRATGELGPMTAAKLRELQAAYGVEATGRFGSSTLAALQAGERTPTLDAVLRGRGVLETGARGPAVRAVQRRLTALGFPVGATGVFGPQTADAVRDFQAKHGIGPNGRLGKTTLLAVEKAERRGEAVSAGGRRQMALLADLAERETAGRSPGGQCYARVADYMDALGYGRIRNVLRDVEGPHDLARNFAENIDRTLDPDGISARYGLRKLDLDDPFAAPRGALIVVRPGAPGTSDPVAGDITVAGGGGAFYNDGRMSYGTRAEWPRGNDHVLGIYIPL